MRDMTKCRMCGFDLPDDAADPYCSYFCERAADEMARDNYYDAQISARLGK